MSLDGVKDSFFECWSKFETNRKQSIQESVFRGLNRVYVGPLLKLVRKVHDFNNRKLLRRVKQTKDLLVKADSSTPETVTSERLTRLGKYERDLELAKSTSCAILQGKLLKDCLPQALSNYPPKLSDALCKKFGAECVSSCDEKLSRRIRTHRQVEDWLRSAQTSVDRLLAQILLEQKFDAQPDDKILKVLGKLTGNGKTNTGNERKGHGNSRVGQKDRVKFKSDSEKFDPILANLNRTNRPGQRARRKLWELRYGNEAKHIKDAAPPLASRAKPKVEALHPSWEAAKQRKQKEQGIKIDTKSLASSSKKIVFSDSD